MDFNLTNFFMGRVTCQMVSEQPQATDLLNWPPYAIHNKANRAPKSAKSLPLSEKIISPSARAPIGWHCV